MAGAEIVDGDTAAEILHAGDEAARVVDILDRGRLGDFDDQPLADAGIGAQQSAKARPPIGIDGRGRRHIDAGRQSGRGGEFAHHHFKHAIIQHAHQAERARPPE